MPDAGESPTISELAARQKIAPAHMMRVLRLNLGAQASSKRSSTASTGRT